MQDSKLYFAVYASSAVGLMSGEDLAKLLQVSRRNNEAKEITGLLLYKDGNIIQALEGPRHEVRKLLEKIQRDPRHRQFQLLVEGPLDARRFGGWMMSFEDLSGRSPDEIPGYSEFLKRRDRLSTADGRHPAVVLLENFRRIM